MTITHVEHTIDVAAPADTVARIIGDVSSWPLYFPPTVHAERLQAWQEQDGGTEETIQIWALANGDLRTWTSRRRLSADGRRIDFRQVHSPAPVATMGGTWQLEDTDDGGCRVRLDHHYSAIDDDVEALHLIERAVDTNSRAELAALKASAERVEQDGVLFTFEDTDLMDGALSQAYAFLRDADLWPHRLPHVARLDLTETPPGLQVMEMDTRSPDGSVHTTRSGRVCFDDQRIVYKQTTLPKGLAAHVGQWTFEELPTGRISVSSRHSVIIDIDALATLPRPPADLADARAAVRHALGSNSRATLAAAREHVRALPQPIR
jgi:aromatase